MPSTLTVPRQEGPASVTPATMSMRALTGCHTISSYELQARSHRLLSVAFNCERHEIASARPLHLLGDNCATSYVAVRSERYPLLWSPETRGVWREPLA